MLNIVQAESTEDVEQARKLFREYEAWLGINLCFQDFEREVAELPGRYAPPDGRLWLAFDGVEIAGCIALRKIGEGICEMKRLYLRSPARGRGLGRQLATMIVDEARAIGYERMRLDTLPGKMDGAIAIYRSLGFKEIEDYYGNPVEGVLFMELKL
ncbi:MAG: GNAT family N-acetyltransferase, partial [Pyrinomonadaceae bacterium]